MLRGLSIAFAKNDVRPFVDNVKDDIVWYIFGDKLIGGKEYFVNTFNKMTEREVLELRIENIITHGNHVQ